MTLPRRLPKPAATTATTPKNRNHSWAFPPTPSPQEVTIKKLGGVGRSPRHRDQTMVKFARGGGGGGWGGGAMMYPHHHTHYYTPQLSRGLAFVGVGFLGCLILVLLGCAIFRLCKKRNGSPRSSPRDGDRNGGEVESAAGQTGRDGQEDTGQESGQHPSSVSSEEGELQHLTSLSAGAATPTRYCILRDSDPPITNRAGGTITETSVVETAFSGTNGTADRVDDAERDESRAFSPTSLKSRDSKTADETAEDAEFQSANNTTTGDEEAMTSNDDESPLAELRKDLTSSSERYSDDRADTRSNNAEQSPEADDPSKEQLSPQTDAASDVSEYLAALMTLEVSSEHSDVTEGDRTQGSWSRTTDDSVQSAESFSRLQDVKAQAEFSPYHIAWSTPLFPQNPAITLRSSRPQHKVPAAKRLNMDVGSAKPFDTLLENSPDQSSNVPNDDVLTKPGCSEPPMKPLDACCRPASAEYRTPRLAIIRGRCCSLGSLTDVENEDGVDKEQRRPLLPYSVSEYRKRRKSSGNVAASLDMVFSEQTSSADSPVFSPSSGSRPASVLSEIGARRLAAEKSSVGSGTNDEDTLQIMQSSGNAVDNTLAGLDEISNSSVGDGSCSVSAAARDNEDSGSQNFHGVLSHSDSGEALSGKAMHWSHSQPTPPSSTPSLTTSPSYPLSSEADPLPSLAASSSDRLADSCFSSTTSPEQCCTKSESDDKVDGSDDLPDSLLQGRGRTSSRSTSPRSRTFETPRGFKVPYPVSSAACWRAGGGLPRSRSSTTKSLAHEMLLNPGQTQLRRSRTSESIGSSFRRLHLQHPISAGSWSDVSVAGSCASRLSLQDPSLTWDNEFTASGQTYDDSLAWDDDPYLS